MSIQIIGNVGNVGAALPMVSAYPLDVNLQYLLAWNPTQQALDYVPYVGNSFGDFTVGRDLTVSRNAAVTGTLAVTGAQTNTGLLTANGGIAAADGTLELNSAVTTTGNLTSPQLISQVGGQFSQILPTLFSIQGTQVVATRRTGWTAATGTATRSTFATGSVTLPVLAEHVKALLDDLTTHGLIGT